MRKAARKLLAALLATVMLIGSAATVFAAQITMYENCYYVKTVAGTNPYTGQTFTHNSGDPMIRLNLRGEDGSNTAAYCIEPGVGIGLGSQYSPEDSLVYWSIIPPEVKMGIARTLLYGFPNLQFETWTATYTATQFIVWEFLLGWRDPDSSEVLNDSFQNSVDDPNVQTAYNEINKRIIEHRTVPSFMTRKNNSKTQTITLKYDVSTQTYTGYATDENNALLYMSTLDESIQWERTGESNNILKITSDHPIEEPVPVKFNKDVYGNNLEGDLVIWTSGSQQVVASGLRADPVPAYVKIQTEPVGTLDITKTADDGKVAGKQFRISQNGTEVCTVTTNNDGTVSIVLPAGTYTVQEINLDTDTYIQPDPQTVTIQGGEETAISFHNALKYGTGRIVKTSEDGNVSGLTFRITGNGLDQSVKTGKDGTVELQLPPGDYTVTETGTLLRYVQPDPRQLRIEPGKTTIVSFHNALKKGWLKLLKQDSWSGGYLSNAEYQIFKADGTDTGIKLISDNSRWVYSPEKLPYGDYFVKETKAPSGYALSTETYPFSIRENGEAIPITAVNPPLSDVYPEFLEPNSAYRCGTEIFASYKIHNNSVAEHTPARPLHVTFTAWYRTSAGTKHVLTTQEQDVAVPRLSENLAYFKVKLPSTPTDVFFDCTVETPEGVVETNTLNNADHQRKPIVATQTSETPDTEFENRPSTFYRPADTTPVPNGGAPAPSSARWQQWEYENGAFTLKTYGVTLTAKQELLPDSGSLSHYEENGIWHMKSGYGLTLTAISKAAQNGTALLPGAGMYTYPQHGNAYFPEFQFGSTQGKYRTLEPTTPDCLSFAENPNTITKDGVQDYRRTHFVPLWYPDGNYVAKTYLYDAWTPAGMLALPATLQPVAIEDNMYSDWYINHTSQ